MPPKILLEVCGRDMYLETKCPDFSDTRKIIEGVGESDFLVSDDKCVHRLVGLKYDSQTMPEPVVTVICVRCQMSFAKRAAFSMGKRVYNDSAFSAMIFRNYCVGQAIMERDYTAVCKVYVDYLLSVDKTW